MKSTSYSKGGKPMKYLFFLCYPRCTTCSKARKWLDENNVEYEERNLKDNMPTEVRFQEWIEKGIFLIKRGISTPVGKYIGD